MENLRLWLSALTTPFIAILGVWIAYQQYRLQQYRFRFDISEQRLAVFFAVREFIRSILASRGTNDEAWNQFALQTAGATFLFKSDVMIFLDQLGKSYQKVAEVSDIQTDKAFNNDVEQRALLAERRDEWQWMREQLSEAEKVFRPYLDLSDA
ncbi:MAG TPA: hypothetical protein VGP73_00890 [Thermoanaerobaculia bacterium]